MPWDFWTTWGGVPGRRGCVWSVPSIIPLQWLHLLPVSFSFVKFSILVWIQLKINIIGMGHCRQLKLYDYYLWEWYHRLVWNSSTNLAVIPCSEVVLFTWFSGVLLLRFLKLCILGKKLKLYIWSQFSRLGMILPPSLVLISRTWWQYPAQRCYLSIYLVLDFCFSFLSTLIWMLAAASPFAWCGRVYCFLWTRRRDWECYALPSDIFVYQSIVNIVPEDICDIYYWDFVGRVAFFAI